MNSELLKKGFTLIEVLIVITIVGIIAGLSSRHLLDQQAKARLRYQRDVIVSDLNSTRQKSVAADLATSHSVLFDKATNSYTILPENTTKSIRPPIQITKPETSNTITFEVLSGASNPSQIELGLGNYKTTIIVDSQGLITTTDVEVE